MYINDKHLIVIEIKTNPNKKGVKNAIDPYSFLRVYVACTRYVPNTNEGVAKIRSIITYAI